MTLRERIVLEMLGIAIWILPENHLAINEIYQTVFTLDDPTWPKRRDNTRTRAINLNWFGLVMNAAAELEDASNYLQEQEAKEVAIQGAKYYREEANRRHTILCE